MKLSLSQAAEIIGTTHSLIESSTTSFSFLPFLTALFLPKFFARYLQRCQNDEVEPIGKTYFIYHVLAAERVHRSRDDGVCPTCHLFKQLQAKGELTPQEQRSLEKCQRHQQKKSIQIAAYLAEKEKMIREENTQKIMVVQDLPGFDNKHKIVFLTK